MSVLSGSKIVNTLHINSLVQQINFTQDAESLKYLIHENLQSVQDLVSDIEQRELQIIKSYLPILSLPTDPFAIISWIPKLILGPIFPQLQAQIKYAMQLVQLGISIEQLASAVQNAIPRLERGLLSSNNNLENQVTGGISGSVSNVSSTISNINSNIQSAQNIVNGAIGPALQRVQQSQSIVSSIAGNNIPLLDTSNGTNFVASYTAIGDTFNSSITDYIANTNISGAPFTATVTSGNNYVKNYPANAIITVGQTIIASDNSIPINTTVLSINTVPCSFSATVGLQIYTTGASVLTLSAPDSNIVIGMTLTSTQPGFANGCYVTNVLGNAVAISAPYLGSSPATFNVNYNVNSIVMSSKATSSNSNASITLNIPPITIAGT